MAGKFLIILGLTRFEFDGGLYTKLQLELGVFCSIFMGFLVFDFAGGFGLILSSKMRDFWLGSFYFSGFERIVLLNSVVEGSNKWVSKSIFLWVY